MPSNNALPSKGIQRLTPVTWHQSEANFTLQDKDGAVHATVERVAAFYPPLFNWVLTMRDAKGKRIAGCEFGLDETKLTALNALNSTASQQVDNIHIYQVLSPTTPDDNTEITLLVHTTAKTAREIGEFANTRVQPGEWRAESGFVSYDEGPDILAAIAKLRSSKTPDWELLTHDAKQATTIAAASSITWRPQRLINPDRVEELFNQFPNLWEMFNTAPDSTS